MVLAVKVIKSIISLRREALIVVNIKPVHNG
jgi:hypothetical protein